MGVAAALAVTGLTVWVAYLVLDRPMLAWTALGLLSVVALLGVMMFARWIPVYRGPPQPSLRSAQHRTETVAIAAEGNFPVALVAAHGLLAFTTLVLVLLTAVGFGGS